MLPTPSLSAPSNTPSPGDLISPLQALLIAVSMIGLLAMDALSPLWGQITASLISWGLLLYLIAPMPAIQRRMLWACLLIATFGEIFLSLAWGLYEYRLFNIPPYVPPGHVLLFLLGTWLARRAPKNLALWVAMAGLFYFPLAWVTGLDEFGIILFAFFIAALFTSGSGRMFATMFLLSLTLELYGTAIGNWAWAKEIPLWGLSTTNPPLGSGTFYCLLDLLIFMFVPGAWHLPKKGHIDQPDTANTVPAPGAALS